MKVFVWDSIVLARAATGFIIVVAETIEEARAIALNEYTERLVTRYGRWSLVSGWKDGFLKDLSVEPVVRDLPCAILIDGSA